MNFLGGWGLETNADQKTNVRPDGLRSDPTGLMMVQTFLAQMVSQSIDMR
jgi:hypothetical protein